MSGRLTGLRFERLIPRGKLIDIPEQPRLADLISPRTMTNENA